MQFVCFEPAVYIKSITIQNPHLSSFATTNYLTYLCVGVPPGYFGHCWPRWVFGNARWLDEVCIRGSFFFTHFLTMLLVRALDKLNSTGSTVRNVINWTVYLRMHDINAHRNSFFSSLLVDSKADRCMLEAAKTFFGCFLTNTIQLWRLSKAILQYENILRDLTTKLCKLWKFGWQVAWPVQIRNFWFTFRCCVGWEKAVIASFQKHFLPYNFVHVIVFKNMGLRFQV